MTWSKMLQWDLTLVVSVVTDLVVKSLDADHKDSIESRQS